MYFRNRRFRAEEQLFGTKAHAEYRKWRESFYEEKRGNVSVPGKGKLYPIPEVRGSQDVRDKLRESNEKVTPDSEIAFIRKVAQQEVASPSSEGRTLLGKLREFSKHFKGLPPEAIPQAKVEMLEERRRR